MRIQRMVTLAVALASVGPAAAQQGDKAAAAEQLFGQGRELMEKGDFAAACPKFEASFELDPALGTLLNLAHCHEKQNELASAWARYRQAADLAMRAGHKKREAFARGRVEALEQRLPRLVIHAPEGVAGMTVTRDGATVDRALWGVAVYVDPGEHEVTATAPGHRAFTATVTAVEAEEVAVDIPVLEPEKPQEPEQPDDMPDVAPLSTGPEIDQSLTDSAPSPERSHRTRRIIGMATGSAGMAALVAGLGVGLSARATWNDAFDSAQCSRETLMCTSEGQEQTDSARSRATLSTVLVGAGAALVGAGVVLYLTAPDGAEQSARSGEAARLIPTAGPAGLGLAITGGF